MPRSSKAVTAVAAFACLAAALFFGAPTGATQLASMLGLLLLLLAAPISMFLAWRHRVRGWSTLLPLVACLLAVPIGGSLGATYRSLDFRYRRLPAYEAVVRQIQEGELTVEYATDVPPEIEHLATLIHVHQVGADDTIVEFFWGGGFPLKHLVYVYRSSGLPPPTSKNWDLKPWCEWSGVRRLNEHWFSGHD